MRQFIDVVKNVDKRSILKEYLEKTEIPEKITVDGKLRWTRNSDGKLIHSTIEGIENFWKWFGDSKVVDGQGRPVIVYHGTGNDVGDVFNTGGGTGKTFNTGAFFTDSPSLASTYTVGSNRNVKPVYLSLKSPVIVDAKQKNWKMLDGSIKLFTPAINKDYDEDMALLNQLTGGTDSSLKVKAKTTNLKKVFDMGFDDETSSTDDVARWSRTNGYESLIIKNVRDRGPAGEYVTDESLKPHVVYVAFSPNQIKSAIGNNGDFSDKSNKITESKINNYNMKDILKYGYKDLNTSSKVFSNSIVEKLAVKNNVENKNIIVFMVDGVYKYFLKPSKKLTESEEIPETIKVNGKERPTKNSNNKLIHPTIQGIENFWKWFGDSKIVDSKGRPLVVYHGTNYEFEDFDETHLGKNHGSSSINGFWFTNDKLFAEQYGANIKLAYLKIHNPTNTRFSKTKDKYDSFIEYPVKSNRPPIKINGVELKKNNAVLYCVFNKNQIKSAIGNNGDFSPNSNKITEAAPTEQLKSMIYYHGTASKDAAMNILKNK
jgi:transcription antitermination factor NusA-like protein